MPQDVLDELIGESPEIEELRRELVRVAPTDAKVLITGESGVGKELIAHAIHRQSARSAAPFIPLNCAGLPETLLESELFGHVRGSFTDAFRDKPGKLELGDRGTVFLDEVGEMSLRMQGMLLRFLETGEVQKVGADRAITRVNVRIVAATNRLLPDAIIAGHFREDLYYRLNVIHIVVPPLRDRRGDVPLMVDHFVRRAAARDGLAAKSVSPELMAALVEYPWPGNVRELENIVERLVLNARDGTLTVDDLPPDISSPRNRRLRSKQERRRTVSDDLYARMVESQESFWTVVYPLYMGREITRTHVRELVRKGLQEARGNYKIVARLFNLDTDDYKRFLNFLRKHDCQLPFKEYRY